MHFRLFPLFFSTGFHVSTYPLATSSFREPPSDAKIRVIPRGSNKTVYVFKVDNTKSFSQSISTASLITRVKVVGQADDDGKRRVDATYPSVHIAGTVRMDQMPRMCFTGTVLNCDFRLSGSCSGGLGAERGGSRGYY